MKRRFVFCLGSRLSIILAACATSQALTYVVVNTQNTGAGSLRQAILDANARTGADRIDFNIPGAGPFVINLQSGLPPISDLLTIDGATQPGYATSPLIEIKGSAVTGDGLQLSQLAAGGCTIRALAITGFNGRGIVCDGVGGNVIVGCHIGIDAAGELARGNTGDGISLFNPGNTIGGLAVADRNVISGNGRSGVVLYGGVANNNRVRGNYIGLKANGLEPLENLLDGVLVADGAAGNTIGGFTLGAGNIISGNRLNGVEVYFSSGTIIHGNTIGLDKDRLGVVSNAGAGVLITSSRNNSVGGSISGARNIISGNGLSAVNLNGDGTSGNIIAGNLLGVDGTGIFPAGNHGAGILLYGPNVTKTRIGGTTTLERNIISGNAYSGIEVDDSVETSIIGNFIGTDATGLEGIPNAGDGVFLFGAQNSIVGGTTTAHRNVIGANRINGIEIVKEAKGNRVQANYIGVGADGLTSLPNEAAGILIQDSQTTVIGGAGALGNKIAFNEEEGVYIESGSANSVLGNSIFGNGALGIDLAFQGLLENDPLDADTGANNLQNFPVLTDAKVLQDRLVIRGSLPSFASATFRIEFFANTGLLEKAQAEIYLGTLTVTTDSLGQRVFTFETTTLPPAGSFITATATDAANNTSEISRAVPAIFPLRLTFTRDTSSQLHIRFATEVGKQYTILRSADLAARPVSWTCLQSISGTGGEVMWPAEITALGEFFQVVEGPCPQ